MKKSILFTSLALITISLTAFGIMNLDHLADVKPVEKPKVAETPNFSYALGTRFIAQISKEDLHKSESATDIVPKDADWGSYPVKELRVNVWEDEEEISAYSENFDLNEDQKELIKGTDYSDNIQLMAKCEGIHHPSGQAGNFKLNYFLTVVPEKQAEYKGAMSLIDYVREMSVTELAFIQEDNLKAGMIEFYVSVDGTIDKAELTSTCGFDLVDQRMIQLIKNAPGSWDPAENAQGEKIEQKLVFFFGVIGC